MQVKFSTFIIALSVLTYLFGVVIASPIPGAGAGGGSPRKTIFYPSPTHKPYVHDKPYPMAPEPVLTNKEWHQERARKWGKHTRETGGRAKEFGNNAIQSVQQGNYIDAAKNAGKSCVMGLICGGVAAAKAVHTYKANKPVS